MILHFDVEETKKIKSLKVGESFLVQGVNLKREPRTILITFGTVSNLRMRFSIKGWDEAKELKIAVK